MRRPRAVRFFAFATCPTPLRQGGASLPLRLRSFTAVLQIPPLCKSAPRVFSVNLQNAPLGQSRAIPAPWRFPPVGCLFTPQVAVCAIVKNVADAIFNRGLQLICLCTMSAPRVFFLKLAKYTAWAKSCDTRVVAFPARRLLVYFTGRRLRNSKKRRRRNF